MSIKQPTSTDTLKDLDHAASHRAIASDTEAPDQSLVVSASGIVLATHGLAVCNPEAAISASNTLTLPEIDGTIALEGLSATKVYYVADSNGGLLDRKLTFVNGILTSET